MPTRLRYPDRSGARLPWVLPAAGPGLRPQIRLPPEPRLASTAHGRRPSSAWPPAVLAHELAHLRHFGLLDARTRVTITRRYAAWMTREVLHGRAPTHDVDRTTSPFIAWIEAFGLFAGRWDEFARRSSDGGDGWATGGGGRGGARRVDVAKVADAFVARERLALDLRPRNRAACEGTVYVDVLLRPDRSLGDSITDFLLASVEGVDNVTAFRQWLRRPNRQRNR